MPLEVHDSVRHDRRGILSMARYDGGLAQKEVEHLFCCVQGFLRKLKVAGCALAQL